jgi:hypothetical protein
MRIFALETAGILCQDAKIQPFFVICKRILSPAVYIFYTTITLLILNGLTRKTTGNKNSNHKPPKAAAHQGT